MPAAHNIVNAVSISFFVLNIQSIRNKVDELTILLEYYNKPGFLCLTEHWLRADEPLFIPNYLMLSCFRRSITKGGGTAIFIREDLCKNFKFVNFLNFDYMLKEGEFEFSIIFNKTLNIYLLCIYRPSTNVNIRQFLNNLETLLSRFSPNSKILLTGDLNIDYSNKDCVHTQNLMDLFKSMNLKLLIDCPTRITSTSNTLIDYFCLNFHDNHCCEANVIPSGLSDHEAIIAHVAVTIKKTKKKKQ